MHWKNNKSLHKTHLSKIIGTLACLLVIPLSACSLLPKEEAVLAPPLVEPAKIEYKLADVKNGSIIKRVKGSGSFYPIDIHNLYYSESGGRISKIHVKEGDAIEKGQLLVEIETGNLQFDIKQTEIDLKKAELHLKQLITQKADQLAIEIAKLDVKAVENRLEHLQNQLSKSQLISPISGVVTFVGDQKAGEEIRAFQSIVQVADTKELQVIYTAIGQEQIADVRLGMEVALTRNGQTLNGKVVQTPLDVPKDVSVANAEIYQKSLLFSVADLPEDVQVGDSVEFEIITQQVENTLIIPKNGLRSAMGRNYVQILENNTKREVDIEVGIITDTEVEVLKGLTEGDKIILK